MLYSKKTINIREFKWPCGFSEWKFGIPTLFITLTPCTLPNLAISFRLRPSSRFDRVGVNVLPWIGFLFTPFLTETPIAVRIMAGLLTTLESGPERPTSHSLCGPPA